MHQLILTRRFIKLKCIFRLFSFRYLAGIVVSVVLAVAGTGAPALASGEDYDTATVLFTNAGAYVKVTSPFGDVLVTSGDIEEGVTLPSRGTVTVVSTVPYALEVSVDHVDLL